LNTTQVAVIAGGLGSRVHNLTQGQPKCLLKVNNSTILDLQLDFFVRNNLKKVHLFLGFGAEQIVKHLESRHDVEFEFHIEPHPRGSAGELISKLSEIDEDLIVVHGDLYLDFPIEGMIDELHNSGAPFIQLVHPSNHMKDSDIVETDEHGNILSIICKPHSRNLVTRNQCNAGVFIFNKNFFTQISIIAASLAQSKIDLDRDLIPHLLAGGLKGRAHRNLGIVRDLGTPERLTTFNSNSKSPDNNYSKPMIFLDRDGVINKDFGWISSISSFEVYDDVPEAIGLLNKNGYRISVVTNQPVVARGETSLAEINKMHSRLDVMLALQNAFIDEYFVCPHHPDTGFPGEIAEFKITCNCRKPEVGLLEQALQKFPTEMANSWMIGDTWRDNEAANRMNLNFIQINREAKTSDTSGTVPKFKDLIGAVNYLLKFLN